MLTAPVAGPVRGLWKDGVRQIRARHPNGDPLVPGVGFDLSGTSLGCPASSSETWPNNVRVETDAGVLLSEGPTFDGANRTVVVSVLAHARCRKHGLMKPKRMPKSSSEARRSYSSVLTWMPWPIEFM